MFFFFLLVSEERDRERAVCVSARERERERERMVSLVIQRVFPAHRFVRLPSFLFVVYFGPILSSSTFFSFLFFLFPPAGRKGYIDPADKAEEQDDSEAEIDVEVFNEFMAWHQAPTLRPAANGFAPHASKFDDKEKKKEKKKKKGGGTSEEEE